MNLRIAAYSYALQKLQESCKSLQPIEIVDAKNPFQADDEGSIPFTRSIRLRLPPAAAASAESIDGEDRSDFNAAGGCEGECPAIASP